MGCVFAFHRNWRSTDGHTDSDANCHFLGNAYSYFDADTRSQLYTITVTCSSKQHWINRDGEPSG